MTAMHVTLVHVFVKPENITDFVEACRLNHEGSTAEPGNRRFDILQDAADPGHFVLYEAYASEAHARAHKETAHYAAWRDTVADMMARPREGQPFVGLFPSGD
jgi:autoinducer 2-degrading protein